MTADTEALRIFSYLPNPRVYKATIAARICGLDVELRGARPSELAGWLWDFDARPLTAEEADQRPTSTARAGFRGGLHKTEAFLDAHPFGTVPAAFSGDGSVGIFESNSIMRAAARLGEAEHPLYGRDVWEASRIDSFLDVSLVFARDTQQYLLSLIGGEITEAIHSSTSQALDVYLGGIDRALVGGRSFLVGTDLTLADICFVCELALLCGERVHAAALARAGLEPLVPRGLSRFAAARAHFEALCAHPAVSPDIAPYLETLAAKSER
jgi:elongation factor 1-gamma